MRGPHIPVAPSRGPCPQHGKSFLIALSPFALYLLPIYVLASGRGVRFCSWYQALLCSPDSSAQRISPRSPPLAVTTDFACNLKRHVIHTKSMILFTLYKRLKFVFEHNGSNACPEKPQTVSSNTSWTWSLPRGPSSIFVSVDCISTHRLLSFSAPSNGRAGETQVRPSSSSRNAQAQGGGPTGPYYNRTVHLEYPLHKPLRGY